MNEYVQVSLDYTNLPMMDCSQTFEEYCSVHILCQSMELIAPFVNSTFSQWLIIAPFTTTFSGLPIRCRQEAGTMKK
jgi:hypothetical protein